MAQILDITAPYTGLEAWLYDRIIAPAVAGLIDNVRQELLPRLPQGGRLLDVGCGGGQIALTVAEWRPDVDVVGLDLSAGQVRRAQDRAGRQKSRTPFVRGSALDLPFPDGSFDAVLSVASIKHWPDMQRGLRECVRVVRPGGGIAVSEADRGCRHEDIAAFVSGFRMPSFLRPLAVTLFRTAVAGHSIDLDDARRLMAELPLAEHEVRRIEGTPGLLMLGQVKPHAAGPRAPS